MLPRCTTTYGFCTLVAERPDEASMVGIMAIMPT